MSERAKADLRIVTLLPSATEIVCALGARDNLVGVSHECDFPAGVDGLPHCSATKRPLGEGSAEIDRNVKAILEDALSVYRVDTALLRRLKPDLIVTQAQCEVCAVSEDDLVAALSDWTQSRPSIVTLSPLTLADVWENIRSVAQALGREQEGDNLTRSLQARIAAIADRAKGLPARRVALIDWIEPLIMGAEWMPELVTLLGGVPVLSEAGRHAEAIAFEALLEAAPDVVVVAPCGWGLAPTRRDMALLAAQPGWDRLPAVRLGEVYLADGNHYFNRPGPRLVESLEILAEILDPVRFPFAHRDRAFERWPRSDR